MNPNTAGSIWRIWDLQVQTILDDRYTELKDYYSTLKAERSELWKAFVNKVGGEENALLFDSRKYVLDETIPLNERYSNYARTLYSFLEVFKPNVGLIAFTDHNYYDPFLLDMLCDYGAKSHCKCICGVEINASGVHILAYFEEPPYQKSSFSDGIKTFLDFIEVNEPKKNGVLTVSSKSPVDVIKEIEKYNGIYIFPHCNSSNGLFQERGRTDRTHLADIFNLKPIVFLQCYTKDGVSKTNQYIKSKSDIFKSNCIFSISKDSRCLKDIGGSDERGNFTWVKSDCHFNGLRQILIEPDRIFIGEEPELIKRVRTNPTKFIGSLSIKKIANLTTDDIWFNNFQVELNCGLVAIIGNKGAGKSAITDILGLCANTHQDSSNFSFLIPSKFRKVKPENLSEKFEAEIVWKDGTPSKRMLNENPDKKLPERVRYIPQNFLEKLCTSVESEDFEKEIKKIIFSHTPSEYKHSRSSLDELIHYKSSLVIEEIDKIKSSISKLNIEIIASEYKTSDNYKTEIENAIKLKQNEFTAHERIKPQKPILEGQNPEDSSLSKKIAELRIVVEEIEKDINIIIAKKASYISNEEKLNQALQHFTNLSEYVRKGLIDANPNVQALELNGIPLNAVFTFSFNVRPIEDVLQVVRSEIAEMNASLDESSPGSKSFSLKVIEGKIKELQDQLDKPAKLQEKYIDDLKAWETQKKSIEGDEKTEGSLSYLKKHLDFIQKELPSLLEKQYNERNNLAAQIFYKKLDLIKIRKELFKPVADFIENFKELKARYDVKLNVTLEYHTFLEGFFSFINQGRIGSFNGKEEGYKRMSDILEKANFDTQEGFISFTSELLDNLKTDYRTEVHNPVSIETQLKKGGDLHALYDYIFHFDYLHPAYNLNLGNKTLLELSPGERGALLLIFYLILDNDDIPLLIDQPEENLDNESVYHILVHFIKRVKEHRQIIIVTHNPNLAVVCDAEQIIHMNIEKENKNSVSFHSGSIENSTINNSAVNILEGTLPAFNNRDLKYIRNKLTV